MARATGSRPLTVLVAMAALCAMGAGAAKPKPLPRRSPEDIAKIRAEAANLPVVVPPGAVVPMRLWTANGPGRRVGWVAFDYHDGYADLIVLLADLPPGEHGFHVLDAESCDRAQPDAHWDPGKTGRHAGPYATGHKGDLPRVLATPDGTVKEKFHAASYKLSEIAGKVLMIDSGGDDYRQPRRRDGGGKALVCGVIPASAGSEPASSPTRR